MKPRLIEAENNFESKVTSDALKIVPNSVVKHYWGWYDFQCIRRYIVPEKNNYRKPKNPNSIVFLREDYRVFTDMILCLARYLVQVNNFKNAPFVHNFILSNFSTQQYCHVEFSLKIKREFLKINNFPLITEKIDNRKLLAKYVNKIIGLAWAFTQP